LSHNQEFDNSSIKVWSGNGISMDYKDSNSRETFVQIPCDDYLQNNGSMYFHIFFFDSSSQSLEEAQEKQPSLVFSKSHPLVKFKKRPRIKQQKNLISGEEKFSTEELETLTKDEIVGYWTPNVTINTIPEMNAKYFSSIPPEFHHHFSIKGNKLFPTIYFNEFWLLSNSYPMINSTVSQLNLTMNISPLGPFSWMMILQMENSFKIQQQILGTSDSESESESNVLKRVLTESNPWLLVLTFVVSILHMVFDTLSFKNDIQHWRQKDSMKATSVRTIMLSAVCQLIIFLYLYDNDASFLVLISVFSNILVELYKMKKAFNVSYENGRLNVAQKESYAGGTAHYDKLAFKYLSIVMIPLVIGYSIYSLYTSDHKGWYSWVISSLSGCVYSFGFIMMTPQLFLNYQYKSVAHLSWRALVYKFLNTIIDDLFAFIIEMPTLHRLAVFRDDLVFFIYLYQRWIYPSDPSRTEEGTPIEANPDATPEGTQEPAPPSNEASAESKKDQ